MKDENFTATKETPTNTKALFKAKLHSLMFDERTFKKRLFIAFCPAFLFAFTLFIFGSYELYVYNKKFLSFPYSEILPPMLILFSVSLILLSVVCVIFKGKVFNTLVSLIYSVALGVYLQGNFLNRNLGALTGEKVKWENQISTFITNGLIWVLILAVPLIILFFNKIAWSKLIKITSLGIVAVQVVTMTTLVINPPDKGTASENVRAFSDENMINVSKEKNTIIFVLDMFDNVYVNDMLSEYPHVFDKLDGFTQYTNSVGVHSRTYPSVTQYLTGNICHYDKAHSEYIDESWENSNFLPQLKQNGFDIRLFSRPDYMPAQSVDYIDNYFAGKDWKYKATSITGLTKSWTKFIAYKYAPQFAKPFLSVSTVEFDQFDGNFINKKDKTVIKSFNKKNTYNLLQNDGMEVTDNKGVFRYFHFYGVHGPFTMDENQDYTDGTTWQKQLKGDFNYIDEYIDNLKRLGVYDNTNIIITADHGNVSFSNGITDTPLNPVFFMKPTNSHGKFTTSTAPVWLMDLRKTILSDMNLDSSKEQGVDIKSLKPDEERERFFYNAYIDGKETELNEYTINGDSNDINNWKKSKTWPILFSLYK